MKCEICHQADAQTVLVREKGDAEEELYVCRACADSEHRRRRNKSMNMRRAKDSALDERPAPDAAPMPPPPEAMKGILPFLEDITNGMERIIDGLEKRHEKRAKREPVPVSGIDPDVCWLGFLHLEGLSLIGEIEAVQRAMIALDCELKPVSLDDVPQAARLYSLCATDPNAAQRIVRAIVLQENNARERLQTELPYVLTDAVCRSLAILKNCQLLSPGEYLDLLSPMRFAVMMDLIDGITLRRIDAIARRIDLKGPHPRPSADEQDRLGMELARKAHAVFGDVMLSERAEDLLK